MGDVSFFCDDLLNLPISSHLENLKENTFSNM